MSDTNRIIPGFLKSVKPEPSLEQEIGREVKTLPPRQDVGNSIDMARVQTLLATAVTAAHDDTGKALDKVREEARALMQRIDEAVDAHKKMLQSEGQRIAMLLKSSVQELTKTVEWMETQSPKLRNPKLEPESDTVQHQNAP
jgi:uncharacterized protein YicC (UPF0701 family)